MVPEDTTLLEASAKIVERRVRRLVVEKNGQPVGIISDTDLFRTVEEFGWAHDV